MLFLTSKVIWTPFRNQEYPPRFLGGRSGDPKENILFQCTEGSEILRRVSLMYIHVIVDTATKQLMNKLTGILDVLAPIKTIQVKSNYVPGLSEETKQLQIERNSAQEKAALTNDPDDWKIFRSLRNRTTAKVREDKRNWEKERFSQDKDSSSDIWKALK